MGWEHFGREKILRLLKLQNHPVDQVFLYQLHRGPVIIVQSDHLLRCSFLFIVIM